MSLALAPEFFAHNNDAQIICEEEAFGRLLACGGVMVELKKVDDIFSIL